MNLLTGWLLRTVLALATGLACFAAVQLLRDILSVTAYRLRTGPPTILERWYRPFRMGQEAGPAKYRPFEPRPTRRERLLRVLRPAWSPALVAAAGLVMLRDAPLAATDLLVMSVLLYRLERRGQTSQFNEDTSRAVDDLIRWFQRGFRVDRVVFPVLGDLVRQGKLRPQIAPLVEEAVAQYQKGASEEQALSLLQGYNVHLDSFVMVLHQATTAPAAAVGEALEEVRQRLRQHRRFRDAAQTNLAQVRLQFGVMRAVFFITILGCVSSSTLRDFYAVTASRQALFIGIVTLGMAGVAYFNQEIYSLQSQTL